MCFPKNALFALFPWDGELSGFVSLSCAKLLFSYEGLRVRDFVVTMSFSQRKTP